jgi:hypothetical protein
MPGMGGWVPKELGLPGTSLPLNPQKINYYRVKWLISKGLIGFVYLFGTFLLQTISKILDSLWIRDQVNRAQSLGYQPLYPVLINFSGIKWQSWAWQSKFLRDPSTHPRHCPMLLGLDWAGCTILLHLITALAL